MEKKHRAQYIDHGFGFPIVLLDVNLVRVRGQWTPNLDYNELARRVLLELAQLQGRLSGDQVKFIRQHFELTLEKFAHRFDVTHPAVLKWEKAAEKPTGMSWSIEKDIRLFITRELGGSGKALLNLYKALESATPSRTVRVRLEAEPLAA